VLPSDLINERSFKNMNVWPRIGMSIALVAAFCIAIMETIQPTLLYQNYKWHFCGSLTATAITFLLIGFPLNRGRALLAKANGMEYEGTFFLRDLVFWGMVSAFCALSISLIVPTYRPVLAQTPVLKTNTPPKTSSIPVVVKAPEPAPTAAFPPLLLQGVTFQEKASSVLINGKTFFLGDRVHGAKLVKITSNSATLEMDGQFKILELRR
jgi:hypothetical protein